MDAVDINDRVQIIRKGNELFNKGDIILAYKCYTMANYYSGIEKIADYFFYTKNNAAKAIVLYKQIANADMSESTDGSNIGGNIRAKQKLEDVSLKIVDVIRKWHKEDASDSNVKNEMDLEQKKRYLLAAIGEHKNQFHTKNTENVSSKNIEK